MSTQIQSSKLPLGLAVRIGISAIVVASLLGVGLASGNGDAEESTAARSTLEGVYTTEQADAVRDLYVASCAECHGRDLGGAAVGPQIAGIGFDFFWEGSTLAELFEYMEQNMPQGAPGSLADTEYLGLVALILEANQQPAGDEPLPMDLEALADIQYEPVEGEE